MVTAELAARVESAVKDLLRSGSLRRVKKRLHLYPDLAMSFIELACVSIGYQNDLARGYLKDARELLDESNGLQHDLVYGTHYRWAKRAYKNALRSLDSLDNT